MPIYTNRSTANAQNPKRQQRSEEQLAEGPIRVAIVESNTDFNRNGSLLVTLLGSQDSDRSSENAKVSVRCLFPFYSVKDYVVSGTDPQKFEDSQQAYGMVFPAPQVGTKGLVLLAGSNTGNISQGYWIGAVHEQDMNHAIPDFAASDDIAADGQTIKEYSPIHGLPVGEFVKRAHVGQVPDQNKKKKPIHPFADVLKTQGLLADPQRGVSTSSYRRETAPRLFGICTPGQWGTTEKLVGPKKVKSKVTKLGGHVFVMDDGDGQGDNNLVRIRTRNGHQVLLNDTDDFVYIGNSKGTAWVELTSNGKIDIFAQDSVSIHTKQDFNFYADRDINFEAGRNFNLKANANSQIETRGDHTFIVNGNGKLEIRGDTEFTTTDYSLHVKDFDVTSFNHNHTNFADTTIKTGNYDLHTSFGIKQTAGDGIDLKANSPATFAEIYSDQLYFPGYTVTKVDGGQLKTFRCKKKNLKDFKFVAPPDGDFWEQVGTTGDGSKAISLETSTGNINVKTDKIVYVDGTEAVHLNLPGAASANPAVTEQATPTVFPVNLNVHGNKDASPEEKWSNWKHYQLDNPLYSIMKRIPTHEPWANHENNSPIDSAPEITDREVE